MYMQNPRTQIFCTQFKTVYLRCPHFWRQRILRPCYTNQTCANRYEEYQKLEFGPFGFSRQSSVEFASLIFAATPETQILKGFFIDLHGCIDIKNHLMRTFFFVQFIGLRGVGIPSISVGTILWRGRGIICLLPIHVWLTTPHWKKAQKLINIYFQSLEL